MLDLFCGAGGLSSGLKMAGFNIAAGIDRDFYSIQTYKNNFPEAIGTVKDLTVYPPIEFAKKFGFKPESFDVIIGGPPCQGFSISGPRQLADPRNQLVLEFIRFVKFFRPSIFIIENVPGMIGLYEGKIKNRISKALGAEGYNIFHKILLASDYGIPQDRRRVFFIGLRKNKSFSFPDITHFEDDYRHKSSKKITVGDAISDLPLLDTEFGDEVTDYKNPPLNLYQQYCRDGAQRIYNHVAARHTKRTQEIIAMVPEGGNYKTLPLELQTIRRFHIAWTRIDSSKPAPTVDTGHRHHFHPWTNRVPTVRENARFQSFTDTFVFQGPKTSQYKQVGNAVPPLLAKVMGQRLIEL